MAACGSLQHIFDNSLPETPKSPFHSFQSWNKISSVEPIDASSFTELFGELHFKENNNNSSGNHVDESSVLSPPLPLSSQSSTLSSLSSLSEANNQQYENEKFKNEKKGVGESTFFLTPQKKQYIHSDSFSSMNSESLTLCTEGLGFESSDDVEDLMNEISLDWKQREEKRNRNNPENSCFSSPSKRLLSRKGRKEGSTFPPPISSIGSNGKPWVCFKSFREDGRFILKEVRIPTQECMHACREDGRLTLQLIQSDDEMFDEEDEDEDDYDDDDELKGIGEDDKGKEADVIDEE